MKKELTINPSHKIGIHFGVYNEEVYQKLVKYFPNWEIYLLKQYVGLKKADEVLFIVPYDFKLHLRPDKNILNMSHSYPHVHIQQAIEAFEKQYRIRYEFSMKEIYLFVQVNFMYIPSGTTILQLGKYKSK